MLKYLRDKLFFDLRPTATTDLSRPLRHDLVACRASLRTINTTCKYLTKKNVNIYNFNI